MDDRRVLLVTGSRALARTPRAQQWASARLCESFAWLLDSAAPMVVHGGCLESPDWWAQGLCTTLGVRSRIYYADGTVEVHDDALAVERRRWVDATARPTPLDRNRYMVSAVAEKLRGLPVRVLALCAPWATTHGTEHTVTLARKAGLDVHRHACPAELGPAAEVHHGR